MKIFDFQHLHHCKQGSILSNFLMVSDLHCSAKISSKFPIEKNLNITISIHHRPTSRFDYLYIDLRIHFLAVISDVFYTPLYNSSIWLLHVLVHLLVLVSVHDSLPYIIRVILAHKLYFHRNVFKKDLLIQLYKPKQKFIGMEEYGILEGGYNYSELFRDAFFSLKCFLYACSPILVSFQILPTLKYCFKFKLFLHYWPS